MVCYAKVLSCLVLAVGSPTPISPPPYPCISCPACQVKVPSPSSSTTRKTRTTSRSRVPGQSHLGVISGYKIYFSRSLLASLLASLQPSSSNSDMRTQHNTTQQQRPPTNTQNRQLPLGERQQCPSSNPSLNPIPSSGSETTAVCCLLSAIQYSTQGIRGHFQTIK